MSWGYLLKLCYDRLWVCPYEYLYPGDICQLEYSSTCGSSTFCRQLQCLPNDIVLSFEQLHIGFQINLRSPPLWLLSCHAKVYCASLQFRTIDLHGNLLRSISVHLGYSNCYLLVADKEGYLAGKHLLFQLLGVLYVRGYLRVHALWRCGP